MNALECHKKALKKRDVLKTGNLLCDTCGEYLNADYVCTNCGKHMRMPAEQRIRLIADAGSFTELLGELDLDNSEQFGYADKYQKAKEQAGQKSSVIVGKCKISGHDIIMVVMEQRFMAGTIAKASGEKIARAFELATERNLPIVIFAASGGIRIQEGAIGLVQMAKITASLTSFGEAGRPFISVLTDPTYGGTTASFALAGDINIAEPGASIGFGGKMLVKNILHENLAADFQTAEYAKTHGGVDLLVERRDLKQTLVELLDYLTPTRILHKKRYVEPEFSTTTNSPAEILSAIRSGQKPSGKDYVRKIFDDFIILSGDRISHDDTSLECGIGVIEDTKLIFIAQCKGRNLSENICMNFGMTRPEGYHKAIRMAELAAKYHLPILILLDSPGAHPGHIAEENNISIAIAESMQKFLKIEVPVVSIITGEGCSGGAMALSVADKIAMFDSAIYAVISPESYLAIMGNDSGESNGKLNEQLLANMKFTARDLYQEGLIDDILKEQDFEYNAKQIKNYFLASIAELSAFPIAKLLSMRYNKIRHWDENER